MGVSVSERRSNSRRRRPRTGPRLLRSCKARPVGQCAKCEADRQRSRACACTTVAAVVAIASGGRCGQVGGGRRKVRKRRGRCRGLPKRLIVCVDDAADNGKERLQQLAIGVLLVSERFPQCLKLRARHGEDTDSHHAEGAQDRRGGESERAPRDRRARRARARDAPWRRRPRRQTHRSGD